MHVLRRSSSSYRLAMRLSSSVLRRPFSRDFVHHRETTSSPWNIRRLTKPRKAGISLIPPASTRRRKTSLESARFPRLSKIFSNQQDSLEPARLPRISKIPSNRTDSLSGSLLPNPADIRPRLHTIETHLPTAVHSRRLSRVASSVIEGHIGLSRVRGESVVGLRPLLIDCI